MASNPLANNRNAEGGKDGTSAAHPQSAGTTKSQRRVGTRLSAPPQKNHNQQSWDELCARKEFIHVWIRFFFMRDAFLSHGNIVGVVIFTRGRIWGTNICRVVTKFEITVLEVPKLQKNPGMANYLPHFAKV